MSIPVQCPDENCSGNFKVKDHAAGKKIRCRVCDKVIRVPVPEQDEEELELPDINEIFPTIPDDELEPALDMESTWKPVGETEEDGREEEEGGEWVTPEVNEDFHEESVENDDHPFPEEDDLNERLVSQNTKQVEVSLGTVFDFSLDSTMMTYVLHWVGICTGVAFIAGGIAFAIPVLGIVVGGFLMVITLVCAWLGLISGIGHMTGIKLATNEPPSVNEAWAVFLRRVISLTFGSVGVWLLSVLVIVLIAALVFGLSNIPYVGQLIGGVLLIPTFIGVIFAMGLMGNMYLIPVVIGVEDCTARQAFSILQEMTRKNGLALYQSYFSAFWMILPTMFWALLLIVGPLAASFALCGGNMLKEGPGIMSILLVVSAASIILCTLAFGVVLVTVTLSLVYCVRSSRAIVY